MSYKREEYNKKPKKLGSKKKHTQFAEVATSKMNGSTIERVPFVFFVIAGIIGILCQAQDFYSYLQSRVNVWYGHGKREM